MRKSVIKSRKRKKSKCFDPNREYLNEAVKDYLNRGGKIKKIVDVSDEMDHVTGFQGNSLPVDEFLMGH